MGKWSLAVKKVSNEQQNYEVNLETNFIAIEGSLDGKSPISQFCWFFHHQPSWVRTKVTNLPATSFGAWFLAKK